MNWVNKIQEAIDFIEANLFEPINAEAVGKAINYAPSSFSNFFSAIVGYSVSEYIRFRRLSTAAERLAKKNISVTDMAFECRYETVDAFTKSFKNMYGCTPTQYIKANTKSQKFSSITINFSLQGGFSMTRNLIPGLQRVDWSDTSRQSEYVNSVVSALNGLGEKLDYDYVCAVSGNAFRTSFSKEESVLWNHGNYHVIHAPIIIEHTFKMLGYNAIRHNRSDFKTDSRLIMESIDKGIPVITIEGVINCSEACLISGYDNDGKVLLGYNPFMDVEEDHNEKADDTGYFRKTNWHDGNCDGFGTNYGASIIIIGEKTAKPDSVTIFNETMKLVSHLIKEESIWPGQYNGLAAHRAFANALMTYQWDDNFEPYLNTMCNYKQYLDRQYAVKFFEDNGRDDLAVIYKDISELCTRLGEMIPQDFSAFDMFSDKANLKPYCDVLLKICSLEEKVVELL